MEKVKYTDIVSEIIEEDKYYQDAMSWYCIRYYNLITEKTYFVLLSIFSLVIILLIYATIKNILPLKEVFPVYIVQKDSLNYITRIEGLKPKESEYTSSEAILKMLLEKYTKEIFTHNYKDGDIEKLSQKLSIIKLYSSNDMFENFKKMFNELSGQMFNKNIEQQVHNNIKFKLIKKNDTNKDKIKNIKNIVKNYFNVKIPTEAEVRCVVDVIIGGKLVNRSEKKILFDFIYEPIIYNNIKNEFTKPKLIVNNYKILEEKKYEIN